MMASLLPIPNFFMDYRVINFPYYENIIKGAKRNVTFLCPTEVPHGYEKQFFHMWMFNDGNIYPEMNTGGWNSRHQFLTRLISSGFPPETCREIIFILQGRLAHENLSYEEIQQVLPILEQVNYKTWIDNHKCLLCNYYKYNHYAGHILQFLENYTHY